MAVSARARFGFAAALAVLLLAAPALPVAPPPQGRPASGSNGCVWTGVGRIIAVGDLHGDYEAFQDILQRVDLIDDKLRWSGGQTHLVQTGDIMDRGPEARRIFDLIKRLEKEARQAGGMVHMLPGNHEELNILTYSKNYPDYVTLEQFLSFLPPDFERGQGRDLRGRSAAENAKFWRETMKDQESSAWTRYFEYFNEYYGRWIAQHCAMVKINDIVFVHGGVSVEDSKIPLAEINRIYRQELTWAAEGQFQHRFRMLLSPSGPPLWNRDLATSSPEDYAGSVELILANLQAKAIVVAHTPTVIHGDQARFGGRVYVIDTGISRAYQHGHPSALIIEDGEFQIREWRRDDREEDKNPSSFIPVRRDNLLPGFFDARPGNR